MWVSASVGMPDRTRMPAVFRGVIDPDLEKSAKDIRQAFETLAKINGAVTDCLFNK